VIGGSSYDLARRVRETLFNSGGTQKVLIAIRLLMIRMTEGTAMILKLIRVCSIFEFLFSTAAQNAPLLVSVQPADGATQVAPTDPVVFRFDQAMDTNVFLVPSSPGLVGGYQLEADGFKQNVLAQWTDDRTITLSPGFQFPYATFTWALNPPGSFAVFRIKSKAGVELAPISGTFTTGVGGTPPALGSTIPLNNATGVAVDAVVEFRFDQAMKKDLITDSIAWSGNGIDAAKFVYSWSQDGRSLFADYSGDLPLNTTVFWTVNPPGAQAKLQNEAGLVLTNSYSGQFTTRASVPCNTGDKQLDTYVISKNSEFLQTSETDPVPDDAGSPAFTFAAFVTEPLRPTDLVGASVLRPAETNQLTVFGKLASHDETFTSEAALDADAPPGTYVLYPDVNVAAGQGFSMQMPARSLPVPKILNLSEGQALAADADFTLRWNGFTPTGTNQYIALIISDTNGIAVFQAPDFCLPRPLSASATSVLIPANTLRSNQAYTASLTFGEQFFYQSGGPRRNSAGFIALGQIVRSTRFEVRAGTVGGVRPVAARISDVTLLANGNPRFTISGTVDASYTVQRKGNLSTADWTAVTNVLMGPIGSSVFEDLSSPKTLPLFYRVVGE
jgi:hypothetical protein